MTDFLHDFARRFAELNAGNLHQRLGELYGEDVHFHDPLHEIHGLSALRDYYAELYANVRELSFDFHGHDRVGDHEGYLRWTMHYRHPRLRGGALLSLEGCSHLRWRDRVEYHRDYFDAGALLYEHLPLLGGAIRWLKGRLA
ncbi:nuclear transport factor 2 family protein [Pseudomonas sp. PDM16]|uniref:nuclear transport factor 2 family protein n=1 Tax=Pseudomonas sp. PDM16 TaxID=2769292 RepID=UPI0017830C1F|nr:nuclear transport factor 2 family protein [Pseudomonas sp. PDM16]MBD9414310.1 nuclear transport factor 2 family protein [Pseudomonas sp. PDM16]